ncbi:MAG: DUF2520 domain-containing protein [Chloroflexi bacterium]|nr:DUF2520 domain-containing protein [Chloroflexota bacterium]
MNSDLRSGSIGIVGAGALGSTLARAMQQVGYHVTAVASRTTGSAERLAQELDGCEAVKAQDVADRCDAVFLTVPDSAILDVASAIQWRSGQAVFHCSGASPLSILDSAKHGGALIGAFHPLQTFGGSDGGPAFSPLDGSPNIMRNIAYAVEAESPLREELESLATDLGGWPIALAAEDRVLYHASAIAACGLLATLVKLSADLWSDFGQSSDQGLRALLPLVRGTLDGIERRGFPDALTGPMVRGDVATVQSHIDALAARAPAFQPIYSHLALASLPIARDKGGLGAREEEQLRELLTNSLQTSGNEE